MVIVINIPPKTIYLLAYHHNLDEDDVGHLLVLY